MNWTKFPTLLLLSFSLLFCSEKQKDKSDSNPKIVQGRIDNRSTQEVSISSSVGPDNAITEANPKHGIKIRPEIWEDLGLKTRTLSLFRKKEKQYRIPTAAIVEFENKNIVYLLSEDRWIKEIRVQVIRKDSGYVLAEFSPLRPDDQIFTSGLSVVRLSYLEAFGASGSGHGH